MPTTRQLRKNGAGADQRLSEQDRPISDDGKVRRFAGLGIDETESARARGARGRQNVVWLEKELQQTQEQTKAGSAEVWSATKNPTSIHREHESTIDGLKRTNADLQRFIESTEIGIIVVDSAMRIRHATPAAEAVFNFASADPAGPLARITHRLDYAGLVEDVRRVLGSMERIERQVRSDTGESFIVRITPYLSLDDQIDGAVCTFFHHTAKHRVEEEMREAKPVAESANLATGRFLEAFSHDFRNPLSAIMIAADTLRLGSTLTVDQEHRIEGIKNATRHLASMIDEILSFAGRNGRAGVPHRQALDARALASEVHSLLRCESEAKDLVFSLDVPDEVVALETDAGKARRILINLCGNAVKYTEAGAIRLRVGVEQERVIFEVSDTGIGIAAADQPRIFDWFSRVDGCTTQPAGGMGIGLTVAREYGRLLGGDVEVESTLGKGTTFRLWLPGLREHR